MSNIRDNYPYNIESPQEVYFQFSAGIDFDYSNGKRPSGLEDGWNWENTYIPVTHTYNGNVTEAHKYMRTRIGKNGTYTVPIPIKAEPFNIDAQGTLVGRDQYDGEPVGFTYLDNDAGQIYIRQDDGWSEAFQWAGEDGTDGIDGVNAPLVIAQYSINGSTLWHDTYVLDVDRYMRFSSDGGTTWSDPIWIAGVSKLTDLNLDTYIDLEGSGNEDIVHLRSGNTGTGILLDVKDNTDLDKLTLSGEGELVLQDDNTFTTTLRPADNSGTKYIIETGAAGLVFGRNTGSHVSLVNKTVNDTVDILRISQGTVNGSGIWFATTGIKTRRGSYNPFILSWGDVNANTPIRIGNDLGGPTGKKDILLQSETSSNDDGCDIKLNTLPLDGTGSRAGQIHMAYTTGEVGIGNEAPTEKLDVTGSIKVSELMRMTGLDSVAIGALTPVAGDIVYNTTINKHQGYDGTIWNNLY